MFSIPAATYAAGRQADGTGGVENERMTINEQLLKWTLTVVIARNKSRLRTNERTDERTNWAKERMNRRTRWTNDEDDEHDGAVIFWVDERSDDVLGFSHYSTCTQLTDATGKIIFLTRPPLIDVRLRTLRT